MLQVSRMTKKAAAVVEIEAVEAAVEAADEAADDDADAVGMGDFPLASDPPEPEHIGAFYSASPKTPLHVIACVIKCLYSRPSRSASVLGLKRELRAEEEG